MSWNHYLVVRTSVPGRRECCTVSRVYVAVEQIGSKLGILLLHVTSAVENSLKIGSPPNGETATPEGVELFVFAIGVLAFNVGKFKAPWIKKHTHTQIQMFV